jgi:hypothetical protein
VPKGNKRVDADRAFLGRYRIAPVTVYAIRSYSNSAESGQFADGSSR